MNSFKNEAKRLKMEQAAQAADNGTNSADALVTSDDPLHPANHICTLCHQFYGHGWVTGTGGGISIRRGEHVFIAPSGVQKELMKPENMFVMDFGSGEYLRKPMVGDSVPQLSLHGVRLSFVGPFC